MIHPGVSATVQDAGRAGYAALGVGASGAMDRSSFAQANAIVGNSKDEAALELLGAGLQVLAETDQVVTVTGAASQLTIRHESDGASARTRIPRGNVPFALLAGEVLTIDAAERGMWSYLAIRGGMLMPAVLGSRSRDTHSGLGPSPLVAGDRIPIRPAPVSAVVTMAEAPEFERGAEIELRIIPGPREDWFTEASVEEFFSVPWVVSNQFSRTAARLTGPALERIVTDELQSEGLVRGSVQVPPDGQPLIFAADHPVTGGYPVIGVVVDSDLDAAAQLGPGCTVRFVRVSRPVDEEWEEE